MPRRKNLAAENQTLKPLRRELLMLAVFGGFGLLVLPGLVYAVGAFLLGEYRPGATVGSFYADLYAALAEPSPWAWLLVLGPWLGIQWLRLLWLPTGMLLRRGKTAAPDGPAESAPGDI
jgi:hypothetical protein